ncbi:type I glyceraldehyde-3-phosphate dehydrogenase [Candidatus Dojkabacteria bacterium]|nr:type I glyceraldehyde-3-phosphate dehydrogenase [Candidatus Dojkabacteria bacterium]
MMTRLAINGFGRIGRMVYRAMMEKDFLDGKIEVVAINDLVPSENLAYLLKYDTMHGKIAQEVSAPNEETLKVGDKTIKILNKKVSPGELPWKDLEIDIVIESTGLFAKNQAYNGHLEAGAQKVIISAPSDPEVKTIVMGVNDDQYKNEAIVSNASCTTNCLAPMVHVLLKEGIGMKEGIMTTVHSYTSTQGLLDVANKKPRRGRAAAQNIIPTTTGAAKATGLVIPEVDGKLTGMAFRVPTADVSVVDLTVRTEKETSIQEINSLMKKASESYLKGILGYTDEPLVSSDFINDPHSSIYDSISGIELNSSFFKLITWYDNEWGYSNRIVDLIGLIK